MNTDYQKWDRLAADASDDSDDERRRKRENPDYRKKKAEEEIHREQQMTDEIDARLKLAEKGPRRVADGKFCCPFSKHSAASAVCRLSHGSSLAACPLAMHLSGPVKNASATEWSAGRETPETGAARLFLVSVRRVLRS